MFIRGQGVCSYPLSGGKMNLFSSQVQNGIPSGIQSPVLKGFPCSIPAHEKIFTKIPCSLAYTPIQILPPFKNQPKSEHKGEDK